MRTSLLFPRCLLIFASVLLFPAAGSGSAVSAQSDAPPDSSVNAIAEAALPDSIGALPREFVTITRNTAPPSGYVGRIDAGYTIRDGHTFKVAVEYHRPGNRRLRKRTSWYSKKKPIRTVQGYAVYKRAYGGVGSGISILVEEDPVYTLVVIRSPRLPEAKRTNMSPEQRSEAPPPEAGLEGMDLSRLHSLSLRFR